MKISVTVFLTALLIGTLIFAAGAPFWSPYSPQRQFREYSYESPADIEFRDAEGSLTFWPWVLQKSQADEPERLPLRFFVEGEAYIWCGFEFRHRFFGLGEEGRIFLLGTDALGRDLFSRLAHAVRFSLAVGLVGIFLTLTIGLFLGTLSGYLGGTLDQVIMRICDLFLSLPGLFLILGLRAVIPLQLTLDHTFWMMILVFALMGWGVVTRVIRGQVMSLKERPYVLAARTAGGSDWHILTRHVLPFTGDYLFVQAVIFVPLFVLGEITLSYLGVGVQEPGVSLGVLLNAAASYPVAVNYPWLLWPIVVITALTFCFNLLADEFRVRSKRSAYRWF
jgi:peptide/nickel transport system permease protein